VTEVIHAPEPPDLSDGENDISVLRAEWEHKFGAKPHHKKNAETLKRELA